MSLYRTCEQYNSYSSFDYDCNAALNAIPKLYPSVVPAAGPVYGACNVVSSSGRCALSLCLSPGETVATNKYVTAVNDTMNVCSAQIVGSKARAVKTAGYGNIPGLNSTYHIFGTFTPKSTFCSTNPYTSPNATDCANVVKDLSKTAMYGLATDSGCIDLTPNKTCAATWCGVNGASISGVELIDAFNSILGSCSSSDGYVGGVNSLDNNYNVSFSEVPSLLHKAPATAPAPLNCFFGDQSPLRTDCDQVAKEIQTRYPTSIPQPRALGDCFAVHQVGTCKAEYCAKKGASIKTSTFLSAFNNVTSGCKGGGNLGQDPPYTSGTYRLNNATVGVTTTKMARNVFCESSKKSAFTNDCDDLIRSINPTYTPRRQSTACQIVSTYGGCKLQYCAPYGTNFNGQQLIDAASDIYQQCATTATQEQPYSTVNGFMQLSPFWNITIFGENNGKPFG